MLFHKTPLPGAYILEPEKKTDHRGFFARVWCRDELKAQGLETEVVQSNIGFSHQKGTLRGLHFQTAPFCEVKIVRCTRGAIYDVIVDLRPDSPTCQQWFAVELNEENCKMIYVPKGFAQGYMTIEDNTEINYHATNVFAPKAASGVRFNDPAFGIVWPGEVTMISDQDKQWQDYSVRAAELKF